jgi:Zn-dependent metalloprotease
MAYGDGDGKVMTDLTKSLDVAGHEMTHGVTSQTSKLIYQSESGALNEAFSDFFGIAVAARGLNAPAEWAIGKDIFLNERKQIGLRNLKAPASIMARTRDDQGNIVTKPYPSHVKDQFTTLNACSSQNDRCFVHINSMIPGHAMYQMAERLGLEKAEKLLYVTLSQYLTPTSDFKAFRTQTVKACRQLFSGTDCTKVTAAFRTVGL